MTADLEKLLEIKEPPRKKAMKWIKRYGPAEIVGTITAVVASFYAFKATKEGIAGEAAAAYAGAIGESIGFYSTVFLYDLRQDYKAVKKEGRVYTITDALKVARNEIVEFGVAEYFDTALLRPFCIGVGARIGGQGWGVMAGKLAADVLFYAQAIVIREQQEKRGWIRNSE